MIVQGLLLRTIISNPFRYSGHITNGEEYIGEASQGDDVSGKRRRMRASHVQAERMPGWLARDIVRQYSWDIYLSPFLSDVWHIIASMNGRR